MTELETTIKNDHQLDETTSSIARRLSHALTRTATLTQEMTDTVTFLTDVGGGVEHALSRTKEGEVIEKEQEIAEKIGQGILHPDQIIARDKWIFFLGVANVILVSHWMGASPSTYYHYWAFKCATLFPLRWWTYRKKGWHYLMLELCYFGNFIGIYHVYFAPQSIMLRKIFFSFGAGPLMWSILAMRNSLVFHDFDKTTTLFMHSSPALSVWTLRWYPEPSWKAALTPDQAMKFADSTWFEMFLLPIAFYFIWVVFYYTTTFVLLRHRIEGRGRATMFSLMVPKDLDAAKRSPLARLVLKARPAIQPFVYLACHCVAACLSIVPVKLFWDYFWLHTAALLFCLALSIYNGGNYYFKVFARKYISQIQIVATEVERKIK